MCFLFPSSSPAHPSSIHHTTTDPPDPFAPPFACISALPVVVATDTSLPHGDTTDNATPHPWLLGKIVNRTQRKPEADSWGAR
jgi:hypothetical protein